MTEFYYPEGQLTDTDYNREKISNLTGLEYAMENGIVLEAKAVLCDSHHNLHVDLGGLRGVIPKEETVYSPTGEDVKDIAIITRVGKSVSFVVTAILKEDGGVKVLLSRRLAQKACHENYISKLEKGDVINASITHIEQFGVFCDIGCGLVALLPIDGISVSRIRHPSDRFSNGQMIKCVIKNIEKNNCRVTLSHKELLGTWEENAARFEAGETVAGIVRSIEPYGIFVELSPNLAGLAEWCDGVSVGDVAAVYIKSIIPEKMKIKLVIVDISAEDYGIPDTEYYYEGVHMDEWRYSPEGCRKEIYTVF